MVHVHRRRGHEELAEGKLIDAMVAHVSVVLKRAFDEKFAEEVVMVTSSRRSEKIELLRTEAVLVV
jgi:hypothetical protein